MGGQRVRRRPTEQTVVNGFETHEPDIVADMYRSLSLYPTSADPARVAEIVERTAAGFKQSPGFRSFTTSVDALMGPGARDGHVARVVVVDFDSLDDALSALKADSFQETRTASEALGATHFLFECREI